MIDKTDVAKLFKWPCIAIDCELLKVYFLYNKLISQ